MYFFDAAFRKFSGRAKVLTPGAAWKAVIMSTWAPDHHDGKISRPILPYFRPGFRDLG
jgi:hypothetical protein